jgi:hypothetical protein
MPVDSATLAALLKVMSDAPALAVALVALYELHAMRRAMTDAVTSIARLEGRLDALADTVPASSGVPTA